MRELQPPADFVAAYAPGVALETDGAALVLVDFQAVSASRTQGLGGLLGRAGRVSQADYRYQRIETIAIPNAARLLEAFRALGLPRLHVTWGATDLDGEDLAPPLRRLAVATGNFVGTPAHAIVDPLRPRDDELVVNKTTLSAFTSTPIEALLREHGVETVLFCGLTTNMCVEHTLRDAADRGFGCVLVEDACATDTPAMHEATLAVVSRLYGAVVTTDEALDALAPTPAPGPSHA